jgi:hypothetical protein
MIPAERQQENQAAFRRLKPVIDRSYPPERFVAIEGGQVIADAASLDELTLALKALGQDSADVLVVQAGVDYPEFVHILIGVTRHDLRSRATESI